MRLISGGLVEYGKQVDLCVNAIKMRRNFHTKRGSRVRERDRYSDRGRERICYKQQLKNGDKMMKNQWEKVHITFPLIDSQISGNQMEVFPPSLHLPPTAPLAWQIIYRIIRNDIAHS